MPKMSSSTCFLILDDDASTRRVIKESLRSIGFKGPFLETDDIDQARKILDDQRDFEEKPVDLILCDWEMPRGSGHEFVVWLRRESEFSALPFIMITAVNSKEKIMKAISEGVDNYLLKPFSTNDLLRKIKDTMS